jgi:hypothetical protein
MSSTQNPASRAVRRWLDRPVVQPCEARVVRTEIERVVGDAEFRSRRDLLAAGEREAALASARFVHRTMRTAREFP